MVIIIIKINNKTADFGDGDWFSFFFILHKTSLQIKTKWKSFFLYTYVIITFVVGGIYMFILSEKEPPSCFQTISGSLHCLIKNQPWRITRWCRNPILTAVITNTTFILNYINIHKHIVYTPKVSWNNRHIVCISHGHVHWVTGVVVT